MTALRSIMYYGLNYALRTDYVSRTSFPNHTDLFLDHADEVMLRDDPRNPAFFGDEHGMVGVQKVNYGLNRR